MKKNLLIILVLIIAVAIVIFIYYKKANTLPASEKPALQTINWEEQMPAIKEALKKEFPNEAGGNREVGIYKEGDVTGDGVPEALIYTGSGGVYTDKLVLVMIENGKPVLVKFKTKDGQVSILTFLSGSSVRHGETADIAPADSIVYSVSWSMDEVGNLETCDAQVYLWNKESRVFEYDQILTDGSKLTLCQPPE